MYISDWCISTTNLLQYTCLTNYLWFHCEDEPTSEQESIQHGIMLIQFQFNSGIII